jgi:asparagine synthase (glutamine-hydrolysing)
MCGIALIVGPGADERLFRRMLASIRPRGDVEESLLGEGLLAGTQRLRIVDRERAVQPWLSADGRFLLCYNGEVYNHRALRAELAGRGHRMRTDGDTEVVLEAFLRGASRRCTGCGASTPSRSWSARPAGPTWPAIRSG